MTRRVVLPIAIPFAAVAAVHFGLTFFAEQTLEELRQLGTRAHRNVNVLKDGSQQLERCLDRGGVECELVTEALKPLLAIRAAREELLKPHPDRRRVRELFAQTWVTEELLKRGQWVGNLGILLGWWPEEHGPGMKAQPAVPAILELTRRAKLERAKPKPDLAVLEAIHSELRSLVGKATAGERQFDSELASAAVSARRMLYLIVGVMTLAMFGIAAWIAKRMLRTIEVNERQLKRRDESYRLAVEAADLGAWQWEPATGQVAATERCKLLLGFPPQADLNYTAFLDVVHPDDRVRVNDAVTDALKLRRGYEVEYRVVCRDGNERWLRGAGRPDHTDDGEAPRVQGIIQDITERRRADDEIRRLNETLERRVRERTTQLQDANRELEAFSYSVSHDLRAPLRSVEGFARILVRDYRGKLLDEKAEDLMRRMSAGARRMGELIEDLLRLSRINRCELMRKPVDLSEAARNVAADLAGRNPHRSVRFENECGLIVQADAQLMRVVLENLLSNAWKFTGKTDSPHVAFGAVEEQGEHVYFIRDNGAGFDMAHADQLFAPFQRLHRSDEFEGTGVGLATVQRIIRRHGGRIWADSKPDHGATVYFTLGTNGFKTD